MLTRRNRTTNIDRNLITVELNDADYVALELLAEEMGVSKGEIMRRGLNMMLDWCDKHHIYIEMISIGRKRENAKAK